MRYPMFLVWRGRIGEPSQVLVRVKAGQGRNDTNWSQCSLSPARLSSSLSLSVCLSLSLSLILRLLSSYTQTLGHIHDFQTYPWLSKTHDFLVTWLSSYTVVTWLSRTHWYVRTYIQMPYVCVQDFPRQYLWLSRTSIYAWPCSSSMT